MTNQRKLKSPKRRMTSLRKPTMNPRRRMTNLKRLTTSLKKRMTSPKRLTSPKRRMMNLKRPTSPKRKMTSLRKRMNQSKRIKRSTTMTTPRLALRKKALAQAMTQQQARQLARQELAQQVRVKMPRVSMKVAWLSQMKKTILNGTALTCQRILATNSLMKPFTISSC